MAKSAENGSAPTYDRPGMFLMCAYENAALMFARSQQDCVIEVKEMVQSAHLVACHQP
jgi:hypothetical protein